MSNTETNLETDNDTEANVEGTQGQETGNSVMADSTIDAIAAVVVIACLVAIATTFISGGLA